MSVKLKMSDLSKIESVISATVAETVAGCAEKWAKRYDSAQNLTEKLNASANEIQNIGQLNVRLQEATPKAVKQRAPEVAAPEIDTDRVKQSTENLSGGMGSGGK